MHFHPADRSASAPPQRERPTVLLSSGKTQLAFTWIGDRWAHRVTVAGRLVAQSVEGAPDGGDPKWPASPVLVELSQLVAAGQPAILAVGLAGRSHFSASVVPAPAMPDTLLFEIACRLQEMPIQLGSTYACEGGHVRVDAEIAAARLPGTVQWTYTIGPGGVRASGAARAGV